MLYFIDYEYYYVPSYHLLNHNQFQFEVGGGEGVCREVWGGEGVFKEVEGGEDESAEVGGEECECGKV